MKIGLDARLYGSRTGIGRYTAKLIDELEKLDRQNEYVIFTTDSAESCYLPRAANFKKVLINARPYGWREQITLPIAFRRETVDFMHFTHFNVPYRYRAPFVVTVHDLILWDHPTVRATTLAPWFYALKFAAYKAVINRAVTHAKQVITISEYSKQRLIDTFQISPDNITVTYEAPGVTASANVKFDLTALKIKQPFLLYVGNAYPHKNLERLIEAFQVLQLERPTLSLVLVGKHDYFYERLINSYRQVPNLIFTGYLPDDVLVKLYQSASLYVFPSLHEGFGLPPLEALVHELPVAAARASCLPEILGNAAVYFDPRNKNDIIKTVKEALDNNDLRHLLRHNAVNQLEKYSWRRCAEQTLNVYQNI